MKVIVLIIMLFMGTSSCSQGKKSFFLMSDNQDGLTPGTGFIVKSGSNYYLVTNVHVLCRTRDSILFPPLPTTSTIRSFVVIKNEKNEVLLKKTLFNPQTQEVFFNYWKFPGEDATLDICIAPIENPNEELINNAYDISDIDTTRDVKVNTLGYARGFPQSHYKFFQPPHMEVEQVDFPLTLTGGLAPFEVSMIAFKSQGNGEGLSGSPILSISEGREKIVGVLRGEGSAVYGAFLVALIKKADAVKNGK